MASLMTPWMGRGAWTWCLSAMGLFFSSPALAEPPCNQPNPPPACDLPTEPEPDPVPAPPPPRWMHQGKPFFVIGVYDYPRYDTAGGVLLPDRDLSQLALGELGRAGFNTVLTWLQPLTAADLDVMEAYGVHALGSAWNWAVLAEPASAQNWVRESSQHVIGSSLDQKLQEVKNKSAFLGYDSHDEMGWNKESAGQVQRFNDGSINWPLTLTLRDRIPSATQAASFRAFVNSRDPHHPVFYTEVAALSPGGIPDFPDVPGFSASQFRTWKLGANAWAQDVYPIGVLPEGGSSPFPQVDLRQPGITLDAMKRLYDDDGVAPFTPTGPILMVLQGQGWNECCHTWPNADWRLGRRPNFVETRFMAFSSIIHGARGVIWWGTESIEADSQLWADIKRVAGQLRYLEGPLSSLDAPTGLNLPAALEGAQRRVGQRNYFIVANRTGQAITTTVRPTSWRVTPRVHVLFEGRAPLPYDTLKHGWVDTFGPWEVHVYSDAPISPKKDDFDGDGRSDFSWYWTTPAPPALGMLTVEASSLPRLMRFAGGEPDDVPITGDYDGDGITDFAMHKARATTGWGGWFSLWRSSDQLWNWETLGSVGDIPVSADYDGDGRTDFAVYHRYASPVFDPNVGNLAYGEFQWRSSLHGNLRAFPVGEPDDVPVTGDFDGDGVDDPALYKVRAPSGWGGWFTLWSSASQSWAWIEAGQLGDIPVVGDYDGDGTSDVGVYTPRWPADDGGGYFRIRYSSTGAWQALRFLGSPGDVPVTGDYDGDGKTDLAVYSPPVNNLPQGGQYTFIASSTQATVSSTRADVRASEQPAGRAAQH